MYPAKVNWAHGQDDYVKRSINEEVFSELLEHFFCFKIMDGENEYF